MVYIYMEDKFMNISMIFAGKNLIYGKAKFCEISISNVYQNMEAICLIYSYLGI